jgi:hypothetical protein
MQENKTSRVHFLASPKERSSYEAASEKEGMTLSQWLRWIANKAVKSAGVTNSDTRPTV